ncbi:MAG: tryptophan synthase subunit alpha [Pseudomonadota bacterium]
MSRIAKKFDALSASGRAAFIPFVMAGDPSLEASFEIIKGLPAAGADIIELGVAFTDPMADGPSIQAAGVRALNGGQTLVRTLGMVEKFRAEDDQTPIILMGYYNPIATYGVDRFVTDAVSSGVDGLIVVDLPPEEDNELRDPASDAGLDFIRLATPTTDPKRLPRVVKGASGFIYYVSVAGVTGKTAGGSQSVAAAVADLRQAAGLPIAVGFGVRTPEKAREFATFSDAVVVGSALVDVGASAPDHKGAVKAVLNKASDIADAVKSVRRPAT